MLLNIFRQLADLKYIRYIGFVEFVVAKYENLYMYQDLIDNEQRIFDRIIYVSPSTIPSRSANSIHVLNQCNALANYCNYVISFGASKNKRRGHKYIEDFYGIKIQQNLKIRQIYVRSNKALQLQIAFVAMYYILVKRRTNDLIISRNFYMSLFLTALGFRHIYETHGPEISSIKQMIQNFIMKRNKVVCISKQLSKILTTQCRSDMEIKVLHDAASSFDSVHVKQYLVPNGNFRVGYFGHLYAGRGIEIIEGLARQFSDIDFYVVGGDDENIAKLRQNSNLKNLNIVGYLRNNEARSLMPLMDVLLMPYQNKVSIGLKNSDTSKWMSPLKMFEYLSSKKPIISSDLPVLKEVLKHNHNALLVKPDSIVQWEKALLRIIEDKLLNKKLSTNAYEQYIHNYTWSERARKLIEYAKI